MKFRRAFLAATGLCAALVLPAAAQDAPQTTDHKEFGDWAVECYSGQPTAPCSMIDVLVDNNTKQRVLSVVLTYVPGVDRNIMRIVVPLGVLFDKGVVLTVGKYKSPVWKYGYCTTAGCFMQTDIDTTTLSAMAHATEKAKATLVADNGKTVEITFSLASFTDAHDLMVDWARQKAKGAAAPADAPEAAPAKKK